MPCAPIEPEPARRQPSPGPAAARWDHRPAPPGQEQFLQLDRHRQRPGNRRQESDRLIISDRRLTVTCGRHEQTSVVVKPATNRCNGFEVIWTAQRGSPDHLVLLLADRLARSRQDPLADGRVQHQHAPAMPHGRIEIRLGRVVVFPLGVQVIENGRFTLCKKPETIVASIVAAGARPGRGCAGRSGRTLDIR